MAAPKRDNHKAARALADAALSDDATACDKHAITLRTLQRYREALRTDPELSQLFAEACQVVTQLNWATQLDITLSGAAAHLLRLIEGATSSSPETIEAVTGAVLGLAEIAMTRDMLAARLRESEGQPVIPAADAPPLHALN